jgi:hypothetical protein
LKVLCETGIGIHVTDKLPIFVGALKGTGKFERKSGTLERFCEWAIWVFISPFYILLGEI